MISSQAYGPWAVITGGSEGVGAAFVQHLAAAGINLVLIARKADILAETADRINAGTCAAPMRCGTCFTWPRPKRRSPYRDGLGGVTE